MLKPVVSGHACRLIASSPIRFYEAATECLWPRLDACCFILHSSSCWFGREHARVCPDPLHVEGWVSPSFCGRDELYPQLPGPGAHEDIGSLPAFCSTDSLASADLWQETGKPGPFSEALLPRCCSVWEVAACRRGPEGPGQVQAGMQRNVGHPREARDAPHWIFDTSRG